MVSKDKVEVEVHVEDAPTPRFKGRFSVYDTDNGGIHIAWLPDDMDPSETQHIDLPAAIIQIMRSVGEGNIRNPMEIVKAVMGANGLS